MWRKKIDCCAVVAACFLVCAQQALAVERVTVRTLVPMFVGPGSLGANVSTILSLRLWTTLRPRPNPNPRNLYFGLGQIEWSRRVLEDTPQAAIQAAVETGSDMALWGEVEEYGSGVVVTSNLVLPPSHAAVAQRREWTIEMRNLKLELGLPTVGYQFSPLLISNDVVAKYSRPDQLRVCKDKLVHCDGTALGNPFRSIRLDGDLVLVRQPSGATGWVALPDLGEAQGEVVDFTAALVSYLRGDFEQAQTYFGRVRDSKADSLVRNDAALLAGISQFRRGEGIGALEAAHSQNPFSRYGVQALVMANIDIASRLGTGEMRTAHAKEARRLVDSYRHLFAANDPWLRNADRALRNLN
jgi:hypothetical protein